MVFLTKPYPDLRLLLITTVVGMAACKPMTNSKPDVAFDPAKFISCRFQKSPLSFMPLRVGAASSTVLGQGGQMSSNLKLDFLGQRIVKSKKAFCMDNSCQITLLDDLSAQVNVPGIAGRLDLRYRKVKRPDGSCARKYRVGLELADLCIDEVLEASLTLGYEVVEEAGEMTGQLSGNGMIRAGMPLLSIAAAVDEFGITPITVITGKGIQLGPINKNREIGPMKMISWDEVKSNCGDFLASRSICKK
ncbi:MAG: hypothetical protein CMP10_18445 [Zetaproteobacteria bacterium]|nr:hypothetical protein [Pseudobdellovibrionaceae bacterium]